MTHSGCRRSRNGSVCQAWEERCVSDHGCQRRPGHPRWTPECPTNESSRPMLARCLGTGVPAGGRSIRLDCRAFSIINVNNNCATGSTALFLARQAVESGAVECALALGFEQMVPGPLRKMSTDRPTLLDEFRGGRRPEGRDRPRSPDGSPVCRRRRPPGHEGARNQGAAAGVSARPLPGSSPPRAPSWSSTTSTRHPPTQRRQRHRQVVPGPLDQDRGGHLRRDRHPSSTTPATPGTT